MTDTVTVEIPLFEKAHTCGECRHFYKTDGVGFCLRKRERLNIENALSCEPDRSWKKKQA